MTSVVGSKETSAVSRVATMHSAACVEISCARMLSFGGARAAVVRAARRLHSDGDNDDARPREYCCFLPRRPRRS